MMREVIIRFSEPILSPPLHRDYKAGGVRFPIEVVRRHHIGMRKLYMKYPARIDVTKEHLQLHYRLPGMHISFAFPMAKIVGFSIHFLKARRMPHRFSSPLRLVPKRPGK